MAILQDGIIVVANDLFLSRLGYKEAEEIENELLLDLADNLSKDELRKFCYLGANTEKQSSDLPTCNLAIFTGDNQIKKARLSAYSIHIDGENLVEVILQTQEDLRLSKRAAALPWKLYLSLLCLLVITILPNLILPKLNINNAPSTFLPPTAPAVVLNDEIREIFPDDEVIVLLFEGVALFSDGFLNAYHQLVESLLGRTDIDDVIGVTNQDHIRGTEDGFIVEPLINVDELEEYTPRQREAKILSDRFARNALIAENGSALALIIIPQKLDSSIQNLALKKDVLNLINNYQLSGYLKAASGAVETDVALMSMVLRDNMIFIPSIVLVGLLLTWVLFHRWIAVITTGVVTGAVVNCTIAFYVLFDKPFNTISGIIPPLLSALTIAALVHFYNALHYSSKRGLIGKRRVNAALNEIRKPALFSALTTSVGLASLGLSPIPPISIFGLTSAAGVFLIYIIVIHLLPPIYIHFDNSDWPSRKSGLVLMDKLVTGFYQLGARKPLWIIFSVVLLIGCAAPFISRIEVETNVLEFFPANHLLKNADKRIEEKLAGTLPMEVVFRSVDSEGMITSKALNFLIRFQGWLEKNPEIDRTVSIADFVEEMHWGFHAEKPEFRNIPENDDLISQYLFIYDGEDLFDFIDEDYQIARVVLNVNVHGANEIKALIKKLNDFLAAQPPDDSITWDIAGYGKLFADQEDLMVEGQVKSLLGAIVLIFFLLLLQWRSLPQTLISMIPNLSPILLIFIVMGIFNIWLDMATAMIASVSVGIAIDDTIHIFHGFIQRIKKGSSFALAICRTYRQAGRAVVTTTIILCSQFLILLAAQFKGIANFGLLTCIGLLTALFFDLILLPAILVLVYRGKKSNQIATMLAP